MLVIQIKRGKTEFPKKKRLYFPLRLVEAMPSKVILMMPKNQELSKFQRFKNQISRIKIQESSFKNKDSRIKFQESRFKDNQDQDSRLKIQESREDLI